MVIFGCSIQMSHIQLTGLTQQVLFKLLNLDSVKQTNVQAKNGECISFSQLSIYQASCYMMEIIRRLSKTMSNAYKTNIKTMFLHATNYQNQTKLPGVFLLFYFYDNIKMLMILIETY